MTVAIDVTDTTFEAEVLERSTQVPVVVDLWASWCGPCRTLGPVLEKLVSERAGEVVLTKVDVDANPRVSATFQVQSIPAVYALKDRRVVSSFVGAQPEAAVRAWLAEVAPAPTEADILVAAGDEASLRQALELEPANTTVIISLATLLVARKLSSCSNVYRKRPTSAACKPRPGWATRLPKGRPRSRPSSTPSWSWSRPTLPPARSTSTCSSSWAPTTPG